MRDILHASIGIGGGMATVLVSRADMAQWMMVLGSLATFITAVVGFINLAVSTWKKLRGGKKP